MKEFIVKISEENIDLASQLLVKLGAEIKEKKPVLKRPKVKKSKVSKTTVVRKKRLSEKISPSYLFGKWKNLEIDAKKIRHEAWDRSQKFL